MDILKRLLIAPVVAFLVVLLSTSISSARLDPSFVVKVKVSPTGTESGYQIWIF